MKDLQKAIKITEKCFRMAEKLIEPGISEKQIAGCMKTLAHQLGARRVAFTPIIATGKNAKQIHPKPTDEKIKENKFVIIDFGVCYKNARTDVTRTYCLNPDMEKIKLIKLIKEAVEIGEKSIEAGMPCFKSDLTVRKYLKIHTRYKFPYALGHGVGKKIHDKPKISPKSKDVFKVGDVFTLEPGLHGSFGGIRFENMYILTRKGVKNLTKHI